MPPDILVEKSTRVLLRKIHNMKYSDKAVFKGGDLMLLTALIARAYSEYGYLLSQQKEKGKTD